METMKGKLIIFCPSNQLRRLLQITGLDTYLNVHPRRAL
jgi:anti-anti-sigma regulatory factor